MGAVLAIPLAVGAAMALGRLFSKRPPAAPPQVEKKAEEVKKSAKEIIEDARRQMGVDCLNFYNYAVCGQSGVGKSSFINGILRLEGEDACAVGEVETTQKIKSYSTKETPYLLVWDIPGAGTMNHPADTYFDDKKLYVFDAILILSSDRFLKVDFDILKLARKYETPCAFVRTKCDIGVQTRAQRDCITAYEASQRFRKDVESNFLQGLANAGLKIPFSTPELFFINNNYFSEKDEAYIFYNKRTKRSDTSLSSMDEDKLISSIYDAARRRQPKK